MIVNSMVAADCQEDVDVCKSLYVVGYANSNPIQLFMGLTTLFVTGHLVFGSL